MNRLAKNGILQKIFQHFARKQIDVARPVHVSLDTTSIKVSPDATGALKKGAQAMGVSRGGRTTKIHLVAANSNCAVAILLSSGNDHDDPRGRELLQQIPHIPTVSHVLMDKAYGSAETRSLIESFGMMPVVQPKSNIKNPWSYDVERYKNRNEIERYVRRLKAYRRIFSRFDKLSVIYLSFPYLAMFMEIVRHAYN
jgi:transposase